MDNERLKVALDRKKAELQTLSAKLSKAEAYRSSPLATAGALVRCSGGSEVEPIWVEGLHYPAQYLIRHTRSMSQQKCSDFTLPENINREYLKAQVEKSGEGVCSLHLLGAVLVGSNDTAQPEILECDSTLAIVWKHAFTLLAAIQGSFRIVWQEHIPESVVCSDLSCWGEEWILLTVVQATRVRAFLCSPFDMGRQCLPSSVLSLITSAPQVQDRSFSCGACWYVATNSCFIVAVVSHSSLVSWSLYLTTHTNQWTVQCHSVTELCASPSSMVRVEGTQCVGLLADTTLIIAELGCIKERHSLVCSPNDNITNVNLLWAKMEEGKVFCVLRASKAWSVVVLNNGRVWELITHQLVDDVECVRCVDSGNVQVQHNFSTQLNIYTLNNKTLQATVTGRGVKGCVWTRNKHFLVLTQSGFLCDFIE